MKLFITCLIVIYTGLAFLIGVWTGFTIVKISDVLDRESYDNLWIVYEGYSDNE